MLGSLIYNACQRGFASILTLEKLNNNILKFVCIFSASKCLPTQVCMPYESNRLSVSARTGSNGIDVEVSTDAGMIHFQRYSCITANLCIEFI